MNSRRTLLIELDKVARLRRDGPALRLALHGRSEQWFPLRRLSRLLCTGDPAPHFPTLLWCAGAGIPVSLLAANGKLIAQLLHPGGLPSPLHHWLQAKDDDPDLQQAWQDWQDYLLAHWCAELGIRAATALLRRKRLASLAGQLAHRLGMGKALRQHQAALQSLTRAAIEDVLLNRHLSLCSQSVIQLADVLEQSLILFSRLRLLDYWHERGSASHTPPANLLRAWQGWGMEIRIERALRLLEQHLEQTALFLDVPCEVAYP